MSLKYSSTTADYLIWSDAMNLIRKLAKDENYKISLLIPLRVNLYKERCPIKDHSRPFHWKGQTSEASRGWHPRE